MRPDGLYRVTTRYLCAGFVVDGGRVTMCAPILRKRLTYWMTIAELVPPRIVSSMATDEPDPATYGEGWYDRIEIEAPKGMAPPAWLTADWMPCMDCRANAVIRWLVDEDRWHVTIAHEDTCPELAKHEGGN